MTTPIVRNYEVERDFWNGAARRSSTLWFPCPHCKTSLKTKYQGPEHVDTCAKCKRGFLVSPERLFALMPDGAADKGGVLPSSTKTPPIVKDYEIATGLWSGLVHRGSTLKFPCPHCKTGLKTTYQSPDYVDDCPTCKGNFLISPERLIARIAGNVPDKEAIALQRIKTVLTPEKDQDASHSNQPDPENGSTGVNDNLRIQIRCEHCSALLAVPQATAGKKIDCPKCQGITLFAIDCDGTDARPDPKENQDSSSTAGLSEKQIDNVLDMWSSKSKPAVSESDHIYCPMCAELNRRKAPVCSYCNYYFKSRHLPHISSQLHDRVIGSRLGPSHREAPYAKKHRSSWFDIQVTDKQFEVMLWAGALLAAVVCLNVAIYTLPPSVLHTQKTSAPPAYRELNDRQETERQIAERLLEFNGEADAKSLSYTVQEMAERDRQIRNGTYKRP